MKMNKIVALATVAFAALVAAFVGLDSGRILAAAPRPVVPGDVLVYDVTVDVQMYALGPKSRPAMTRVTSGAGTETIAIDRVASDGTAFAGLTISFRGTADGRPVNVDQSWRAQLAPDGEIHSVGARPALGEDLDQALSYINGLTKGLRSRTLASGTTWTAKEPLGSSSGSMIITNTVVGVQPYHGYRTYVIAQNGAGAFTQSIGGSPGVGSIAIGGTLYYDKADHVLIGGAARGQTEMALTHADIAHISATTTVKVQMRSWTHAPAAALAPPPAASSSSATPSVKPSASPAGGYSPTPTPAYTPAPASTTTPSPINTGN
jgi:hypothetical protein